jgi:putative addiction module component (TIGR02574 family)
MLLLKQFQEGSKSMRVKDIPEIEKLSIPEKILLVEDIWDNISAEKSAVPVPQSHMTELDRRLAKYKSGPGELLSLDELKLRIESRK